MDLYDTRGHRLYLTADERRAFLSAAKDAALPVRTFCLVLHYTGCRISEALALTPQRFDFAGRTIVAGKRHRGAAGEKPLWAWSRTTAWRRVKEVLDAAGIVDGPHKIAARMWD